MSNLRVEYGQMEELFSSGSTLKGFAHALKNAWDLHNEWEPGDELVETSESHLNFYCLLLGLQGLPREEVLSFFPHRDTSRMFYATRVKCDSLHLNYNSHLILHVEPSRWLRLSYLLGCTPSETTISSTLKPWSVAPSHVVVDSGNQGFHETHNVVFDLVMKDSSTYSDWLNRDAEEFNFEIGLKLLGNSEKAAFEDRDVAEAHRYKAFMENVRDIVW